MTFGLADPCSVSETTSAPAISAGSSFDSAVMDNPSRGTSNAHSSRPDEIAFMPGFERVSRAVEGGSDYLRGNRAHDRNLQRWLQQISDRAHPCTRSSQIPSIHGIAGGCWRSWCR